MAKNVVAEESHKKCVGKNRKHHFFQQVRGMRCKKWVFGRLLLPLIRKSGQTFWPLHINKSALSPGLCVLIAVLGQYMCSFIDELHQH